MSEVKRVLVICLGNICRSPIGEAVFQDYITKEGLQEKWDVHSAALVGYHTGKSPDHRAMATLREKGLTSYKHKARPEDFEKFDWIFGMDNENISHLNRMKPSGSKAKIELLGKYDPNITKEDFEKFDWIFGMDNENISHLNRMKPAGSKAKIELLGKYDPKGEVIIRDPYYDDGSEGFVKAYEQCVRSVAAFMEQHKND